MKVTIQTIFYNIFILLYTIILFSNLFPVGMFSILTKSLGIILIILSFYLINQRIKYFINAYHSIFFVFFILLFHLFYTIFSLLLSDLEIVIVLKNNIYINYFILIFGFVNILYFQVLEKLLNILSKIFLFKLVIIALIIINMNFGLRLFESYILDDIDLVVHELFNNYRVLDQFFFLFPLVLFFIEDKSITSKFIVHILLLFVVVYSMTVGMIFSYILIVSIYYKKYLFFGLILFMIVLFIYSDRISNFYDLFFLQKDISVSVKYNQYVYALNNISFFGNSFGQIINIEGRKDSMLENVFFYWLIVYGIFGFSILVTIFILFPFYILIKFGINKNIKSLFFTHFSILIASLSNPYLVSAMGVFPMIILVSYYFQQTLDKKVVN